VPGGLAALTRCEGLRFEGLEVSITTRSPKIVDDLDLLVELDRRCSVSVDVTLASLDPFLVRRLEPGAPGGADARARLRMVARLAAEGIAVRLVCTPWRPGLNDGEPALRALVAAARQAGAQDVVPGPLSARPSRLARLRGALTGRAAAVIPEGAEAGLAVLRRLRLEYGFPRLVAGRG
jgi:DNA repair photolyase